MQKIKPINVFNMPGVQCLTRGMGKNSSALGKDFSSIKCDAKGSRVPGFKDSSEKLIGDSFLAVSMDEKEKNEGPVT